MKEKKKEFEKKLRSSLKKGLKYAEMAPSKKHDIYKIQTETSDSSIQYDRFPTFNQNKYSLSKIRKSQKRLSLEEEGQDVVNAKLFDKSRVKESEEIIEVDNPLFKGSMFSNEGVRKIETLDPNSKTEHQVFSLYQDNQFYKNFANLYQEKVENLLNRLQVKSNFAFRNKMMHFTNETNVYRPSGAAFAIAKNAMKSRLITRKESNKRRQWNRQRQSYLSVADKSSVLSKLKGQSLTPKGITPRHQSVTPKRTKYGVTTTGVRLTLEERIKWLEDGVPPSGRTRQQLGIIIADGDYHQDQLLAQSSQQMLGREAISVKGNQKSVMHKLNPAQKRERIKTYGKWYLKPNNFNLQNEMKQWQKGILVAGADRVRQDQEEALFSDKQIKKEVST